VQIHPPGAKFAPNGLPLARLPYKNDDGGPGYGKDSYLVFTAPADADYLVRLRDVRGFGGDEYAYRLAIRAPRPDFRLTMSPLNPNVPRGGTIPVAVTAFRMDGFDGPIALTAVNLPAGLSATENVIPAGHESATLLLSAEASAKLAGAAAFEIVGQSSVGSRKASPEESSKLIALAPAADVVMTAETKVIELEPGETAEVVVRVDRRNGFLGRVPVQVRDLPNLVRVTDSGLNGVLVNEDETRRPFKLWALPNAAPLERYIYVAGVVETRSPQQNAIAAPERILVRVKPRKEVAAR